MKHRMSWESIKFISAPSSRMLNFTVTLFSTALMIILFLSFVIEMDVAVHATGSLSSNLGIRDVVAKTNGYLISFVKEVGTPVKKDDVIGAIAMDQTNSKELDQLRKTLDGILTKLGNRKDWATAEIPSPEFPITKLVNKDLVNSMIEVDRDILTFKNKQRSLRLEAQRQIQPLLAKQAKLTGKRDILNKSKNRALLELQLENLDEEILKTESAVAQVQNMSQSLLDESVQNLVSSIKTGVALLDVYVEQHLIKSPVDGVIGKINVTDFSNIKEFQSLASILPQESQILANISVKSRDLPKIKKDQKVLLKLEAYPYYIFGSFEGTVLSVEQINQENGSADEYSVKSTITLPRTARAIASAKEINMFVGMKFSASVITARKKVISVMVDKILGSMN